MLREQRLEPRVLANRIPARVEPQGMDAERNGGPRHESLDLIERGVHLANMGQDSGSIFRHNRPPDGVVSIHLGVLDPTRLLERLVAAAEAG